MRVQSTLLIAFLVPILALLASVRAAPSSGLQSRDDLPLKIGWAGPEKGQKVTHGNTLTLGISVSQNGSPPPYSVEFKLYEEFPTGYNTPTISYSLGTFDLNLSPDGSVLLYDVYIPAGVFITYDGATIRAYYNGIEISRSDNFQIE